MQVGTLEGTRLGDRYVLGGLLGRGGMAEVYDGVDERLGRPVAVKVLRASLAMNPEVRRRFESEARAAARLTDPNVVTVHDTGEDSGTPYIVMERLPGETLADRIRAGAVDQGWLRRVAGDVLQALAAAHGAGIIHRDVKPGNILIAPDGCAKVADFGIAKSTEALGGDVTATNVLLGTPAYLAPERIDGEPATPESDLYSLGVVLYEAMAGVKPYHGQTPVAVARSIHDGDLPPVETLRRDADPVLAMVVAKAMAPSPADRYHSAEEMRAALDGDATLVADIPVATTAAPTVVMEAPAGPGVGSTAVPAPALVEPKPAVAGGATVAGGAPAAGRGPLDRRVVAALVGCGLVILLLLVLALGKLGAGSAGAAKVSTSPGTTLATQLRTLAAKVQPSDPAAATRITSVADLQASADRAGTVAAATAALRQVTDDHQTGRLSDSLTSEATSLLQQAGASPDAAPTTTTMAPPTTAAPSTVAPAPPKGPAKKGKGKKDG